MSDPPCSCSRRDLNVSFLFFLLFDHRAESKDFLKEFRALVKQAFFQGNILFCLNRDDHLSVLVPYLEITEFLPMGDVQTVSYAEDRCESGDQDAVLPVKGSLLTAEHPEGKLLMLVQDRAGYDQTLDLGDTDDLG